MGGMTGNSDPCVTLNAERWCPYRFTARRLFSVLGAPRV
jgi:hypothetical protein